MKDKQFYILNSFLSAAMLMGLETVIFIIGVNK